MNKVLELAYANGFIGNTFATRFEYSTPGWSEAYAKGAKARAEIKTEPCLCPPGPCPLLKGGHLGVHTHCRLSR